MDADMDTECTIRPEEQGDADAIRTVLDSVFRDPPEESILVDVLRVRGKVVSSLVAVCNGRVVGHILFTPLSIENAPPHLRAAALAPLAVLPEFQRKGIGSRLVMNGIDDCRAKGYHILAVLGNPKFYGRFGFRRASDFGVGNEYEAKDAFMILVLDPTVVEGISGTARYVSEFQTMGI